MDTLPLFDQSGNLPEKKCMGPCGRTLPATTEFFHKHSTGKYGLYACCKQCRSFLRKNLPVNPISSPGVYKQCTGPCGRILPATTEFFSRKSSNKRYGLYSRCKECDRQYRIDHKEEKAVYHKQYRLDHKEERSKSGKSYFQANKEKIYIRRKDRRKDPTHREKEAEYRAAWYHKYREEMLQIAKRYAQTPQGRMVRRAAKNRYRARKKSALGSYTAAQIQDQLKRQKHRCYYAGCGHKKFEKKDGKYIFHIEHIVPLSRGGTNTIDNIVLSCPACNMHKHNKLPHEWPAGGRLI